MSHTDHAGGQPRGEPSSTWTESGRTPVLRESSSSRQSDIVGARHRPLGAPDGLDSLPHRADTRLITCRHRRVWRLENSMWWFIIGIVALIAIVAIVLQRRGSTAAHDTSSDYHPDTSMGGADPN
jgi:hypothetical protein